MHCCIVQKTVENAYEHVWQWMEFNSDFSDTLRRYGRLPIGSIEE